MILKLCTHVLSALARLLGALFLITFVIPLAYFAWRAGRPMSWPEFHGLTYIQLLVHRRQAYDQFAHTYQAGHPDQSVRSGICFDTELGIELLAAWPSGGLDTLAAAFPALQKYVDRQDIRQGILPKKVTIFNFLPSWWNTFEKLVWGLIEYIPHGPVPYCRIAIT